MTALALASLSAGVLAMPAPPASAATTVRTRVSVNVNDFTHLAFGNDAGWPCDSRPEYRANTDIGMFELPRVDRAQHQYEDPFKHPVTGWSVFAGASVDVSGTVTTFTNPDYRAQEWISGTIGLVEDDDGPCGGPDDVLDINPQPGLAPSALRFIVEPSTGTVFAYNYRDPLRVIGRIRDASTGALCRFGPGKTCSGNVTTGGIHGNVSMRVTLRALS